MKLTVKNLAFSYDNKNNIFENINFTLNKGDILGILGPNGTGKSTLLNCISSYLKPKTGEIFLDDVNIEDIPARELAKKIGYVQQITSPTYDFTVREYVMMGRTPYLNFYERPGKKDKELVDEAISIFGIENIENKSYRQISGGEMQKASMARVLVQNPDIIILDEPTNHLDFGSQFKTLEIIHNLSKKGFIIIYTTHNPDHIFMLENYVAILNKSKFSFGSPQDLISENSLKDLYDINIKLTYSKELNRFTCGYENIQNLK